MECKSKVTKAIPTDRSAGTAVATTFDDHSVSNLSIPASLLADNSPQLTPKVFQVVCAKLRMTSLMPTEYHLQTDGQVERYNKTIFSWLRLYVIEDQQEWDSYVVPLTCSYKVHVNRSTKNTIWFRFKSTSNWPSICSYDDDATWRSKDQHATSDATSPSQQLRNARRGSGPKFEGSSTTVPVGPP